ncbi:hypothetical protein [Collinsella ihumii]|uniref:hypothetical protein n=1 Tax=Collinsella ihumii TaxID=1720204 RepID=UPI0025ADD5CE|nr:hypothetical protein [Collinsella ihumii]
MRKDHTVDYDLYFCGLDKGRLPILIQLYDSLSDKGVKCRFDIISNDRTIERNGIEYLNQNLCYKEMLQRASRSKALLEILADPLRSSPTLRTYEAIALNKKLLTNNQQINQKVWYSSNQIQIIGNIDKIDVKFITNAIDSHLCIDSDRFDPNNFINFIKHNLNTSNDNQYE